MQLSKAIMCAVLLSAGFLSACGGGSDGTQAPAAVYSPDAKYGSGPLQSVTLFEPPTASKGLLVWVHGGGWVGGDKDTDLHFFEALLPRGFAVLNVNYRLGPDGAFPRSVDDIKTVLATLDGQPCAGCTNEEMWRRARGHASRSGVMVAGVSAGGHLAIYAGAQTTQANPASSVRCIMGQLPPVDFRDLSAYSPSFIENYLSVFASADLSTDNLRKMSPAAQVEQGAWTAAMTRSWYLLYSVPDYLVPFSTTRGLGVSLSSQGAKVSQLDLDSPIRNGHNVAPEDVVKNLHESVMNCFGS